MKDQILQTKQAINIETGPLFSESQFVGRVVKMTVWSGGEVSIVKTGFLGACWYGESLDRLVFLGRGGRGRF